jgi:hypothetical protein
MLRNASPAGSSFLIALIALAGCGSSGQSLVEQDTAVATGDETGPTPQTTPTLETGVDQAALAAAVTPQVIQTLASQMVQSGLGLQPSVAADTIQLGRAWGEFDVHKGPQLVFRGSWQLLVASGGDYFAVVGVVRDGDSYRMASIGSTQFVPTMVAREQMPAVSAALDRGRAGFLRPAGMGGDMYLAYEAEAVADAGNAEIRVQPLALQVIDAGVVGVAEMSLNELDAMLPAE